MPDRRRSALIAAGVVALGLVALAWDHEDWLNHLGFNRQRNRAHILGAYAGLRIGMTAREAHTAVSKLPSGFTVHGACGGSGVCVLDSPLEFGARNWMLYLQFDDERLSSARIRTADSMYEHPAEAPPDIGQWREVPREAAAQQ